MAKDKEADEETLSDEEIARRRDEALDDRRTGADRPPPRAPKPDWAAWQRQFSENNPL